ncbi:NifU family protein [Sanyastnella coralliicola]|uniref:NifU family protein n=1 Tax=Sanyastnella coralliicola TaxID=3069118 RepID=UPI0027B96584|nr:NifU family protein [Longitalea sp. SCSIO 12813]
MKDLKEKIEHSLEELRPFLRGDGGDISLVEVTDDLRVLVELHGACSNCSMSMMTMKAGVEEAIRSVAPEVKSVEAINLPDPETATPFGK